MTKTAEATPPSTSNFHQVESPTGPPADALKKCGSTSKYVAYIGSDVTSCGFAVAVAKAAPAEPATGPFNVSATSPVTGQNYQMSCTAQDHVMRCSGGNNAIVLLTPNPTGVVEEKTYEYALEGTVVLKNTAEVLEGLKPPNNDNPNNEYILLWFDNPMDVAGKHAGNRDQLSTKNVRYLSLGKKETTQYGPLPDTTGPWRQYVGKRIRLHVNSDNMWYPSDTGLPLGALRLEEAQDIRIEEL
ncbi:hypothetical protein FRC0360_01754 [Corynebacterium diphtheriae]|nr:hypothetical protein FRC0360_01754 [Corynebacterium diphtheriae]CAB0913484.1 hypothetical protein FRC0425_01810 [Corynebacterium diphtheriae]